MSRLSTLLCLLVLAGSSFVACGDDTGSGPVSLAAIPAEMGQMMCGRAERCCNEADLQKALDDIEVETLAECEVKAQEQFGSSFEQLQESVDAGRMAYHADEMRECVRLLDAVSCDSGLEELGLDEPPAPCEAAVEPLVGEGGQCGRSAECKVGRCVGAEREEGVVVTLGICRDLGSAGDACDFSWDCKDENYCNADDVCAPRRPAGAPCSYDACVEGLYCNDQAEQIDPDTGFTAGTCEAPAQPGEACGDSDYGCASEETYCDTRSGDDHEPTYTCVPRGDVGEPCYDLFEGCGEGAWCDVDGTGTCQPGRAGGEACEGNSECLSGNCRDDGCAPDISGICRGR